MLGKLIIGGIAGGVALTAAVAARTIFVALADQNPDVDMWDGETFKAALPHALKSMGEDPIGHAKNVIVGFRENIADFAAATLMHGIDQE